MARTLVSLSFWEMGICFFLLPFFFFIYPSCNQAGHPQPTLIIIQFFHFFHSTVCFQVASLSSSQQSSSSSFTFLKVMRGQFLCFMISILHILNLVLITNCSRPLVPNGTELEDSSRISSSQTTLMSSNEGFEEEEEEEYREVSKIGSSPPSCEHKCYGCMPCQAIQVPTTTSHVGVQYANYEPEGWKCKCGPTFYAP